MKKGEISINIIFIILISIISIIMLLALFSAKLTVFGKTLYCKTFFYVHSSTFMPRAIRQDQSYCIESMLLAPPVKLSNDTSLNVTFVGYMAACWKQAEYGRLNRNIRCYELTVGPMVKTPYNVKEKEISNLLIQNEMCEIFPNVDPLNPGLRCGDGTDSINWGIINDQVLSGQNILIEYDGGKIRIS